MTKQSGDPATDDQLLSEFLTTREEVAFVRLVDRHGPMVLRTCSAILGDHADAEDAFQATFLHLFRQADSIRDRGSVRWWLRGVARRVAHRARRRQARHADLERQATPPRGAEPVDRELAEREWQPILREEIGRLPPKLRDIIELFYLEGLTVEAASRRLNCPPGTLKTRLGKGRELLRQRLTRRGLAASLLILLFSTQRTGWSATVVPTELARSTVARAVRDPDPVADRVEALAAAESKARGRIITRPRLLLAILLLLVVGGVLALAVAAAAEPAGNPPRTLVVRALDLLTRWISTATDFCR